MSAKNSKDIEIESLKKEIQSLKAENYCLNYVLNQLPVSIYWKDKEGRYLGCNQYVAGMAGVTGPDKIIGKTDAMLPWSSYSNKFKEIDSRIIEQGATQELEEEAILSDQRKHYVLTTKTPLRNNEGNIIGVLGVSIDITERKKIEQDLVEAIEKAEVANKAKEQFLYNMRHDIRTPFSGILGLTELMLKHEKDAEKLKFLNAVYSSSERLLDYLNEILELTQIQDGVVPILSHLVSLKEIGKKCIEMFLPALEERHLSFAFDYDESLSGELLTDEFRIKRILINLLGNAIKFTSSGFVRLKIYYDGEKEETNEILVSLCVEDSGIGIPQNKQVIIFEKFERLSPSYEGKYEGSGLGLFTVKTLINELDGEIELKSQTGKGSTFICRIPMRKSKKSEFQLVKNSSLLEPVELNFVTAIATQNNSSSISNSKKILLVEDSTMVQFAVISLFSEFDYIVDVASTGLEAVQLYQASNESYAFILMDIGLPDIDGYEVTKQIRMTKNGEQIPIIALTAHAVGDVQEQCNTVGMNDAIQKPLTTDKALQLINVYGGSFKKLFLRL